MIGKSNAPARASVSCRPRCPQWSCSREQPVERSLAELSPTTKAPESLATVNTSRRRGRRVRVRGRMSAGHEEQRVGTDDPIRRRRRSSRQSVEHVDGSIRVEVPDESEDDQEDAHGPTEVRPLL